MYYTIRVWWWFILWPRLTKMKTEEQKREEIRAEIERVKAELDKIEHLIRICPWKEWARLRKYCNDKQRLEWEKYRLVNLLNIVK